MTPLLQRIYVLLKVHIYVGGVYTNAEMVLQGFVATLIYALVTPGNNRCKLATDIYEIWQRLYVFVQITDE